MFRNVIIFFLVMILVKNSKESLEEDTSKRINHSNVAEKSLSRKRRYLTFPSGSSLQLVYCLTMPSVGVGEIYTFGLTAALAWELPSTGDELLMSLGKRPITTTTEEPTTTMPPHHHVESDHLDLFDHPSQRKSGHGSLNHLSDEWTYKNNKHPAPVTTPNDPLRLKENFKFNRGYTDFSRNQLYSSRKVSPHHNYDNNYGARNYNEIDNSYVHPIYHQIHRRTRRDLYVKLEKLLTALSKDGKACLKKAICEVSQVPPGKGTLYQELMKTIFRIKPHDDYEDEDDYDRAANKTHDCSERYSSCQHSVWTDMF
ncbi:uncharacterized protein LOC114339933 [Diabrotica virgifera virgifera]|uniref:Uncharacterized protein LOC114339933 n=1 Tax=Diabrotica virgifera virgifera TaxID=50390 RepID=A0A6P7GB79_DIAVI|nr:uncharacterized protein LOC114339933 [Diabrotica virgifera virgifera]